MILRVPPETIEGLNLEKNHDSINLGFKGYYCSRAFKSRSKLGAAIGLRAAFGNCLLHENRGLLTVTFGDKVPTLAKSRG